MTKNSPPSPTDFGSFDPPTLPELKVLLSKVGLTEEMELLASRNKNCRQIPNNPKQFLVSIIVPNYEGNPYQHFNVNQAYNLTYQHTSTVLHFRCTYKGFNMCSKREGKKMLNEVNIIFSGVMQLPGAKNSRSLSLMTYQITSLDGYFTLVQLANHLQLTKKTTERLVVTWKLKRIKYKNGWLIEDDQSHSLFQSIKICQGTDFKPIYTVTELSELWIVPLLIFTPSMLPLSVLIFK